MPKGQTSRPYNRKEKQAVSTKKAVKNAGKNPSLSSIGKVVGNLAKGRTVPLASITLQDQRMKELDRKLGKSSGRKKK